MRSDKRVGASSAYPKILWKLVRMRLRFALRGGRIFHKITEKDRLYGEYFPETNRIHLYQEAELETLFHELYHFEQAARGGYIGRKVPPDVKALYETEVDEIMAKEYGFAYK